MEVSIPQAVGVVATHWLQNKEKAQEIIGFNTASGRCCCNDVGEFCVATSTASFNTASGRCCCNSRPYRASIHGA